MSHVPASHEATTALGTSYGPDTVLEVTMLAGEEAVAYTVGFSGAAYDLTYALYLAPIPSR